MSVIQYAVRAGAYYDSVMLMQAQRALAALPGVLDAGVVMATPANLQLLAAGALLMPDAPAAQPDDLLIVVRAENAAAATVALQQLDGLLRSRGAAGADAAFRPKSLESAVRQAPQAGWVLISTPGRYAAGVARQALALGRHVFLYSDNVPLQEEVALKASAWDKGLLVMGPDCGTAIINGVGLGFANRVRRGPIGLVAASGTGLQAIASAIHNLGGGISQAFGVGGRDLSAEVGALTTRQALHWLEADTATTAVVVVSKPPAAAVVASLLHKGQTFTKPLVLYFIGWSPPARRIGALHFALSLEDAAALALAAAQADRPAAPAPTPTSGFVRGLFSGGTLAYEMTLALQALVAPLYSNTPVHNARPLPDPWHSQGHTLLDLGDDLFTQGRLHPMLDHDLRLRRLRQEAQDPAVGCIVLDVVLGEGAHPDPAAGLAPAIAEIKRMRALEVMVLLVGTDEDPQDRTAQAERFQAAGAQVYLWLGAALEGIMSWLARHAPAQPAPPLPHIAPTLAAINVGLEHFHTSLLAQGAASLALDWRPPAGGNERLMALLARLNQARAG